MTHLRAGIAAIALVAATPLTAQELTLYSGRGETLVEPIIETFTARTGIDVTVRYGGTSELAVLLQEEGDISPADLYWAQDVAALGNVADLFAPLPEAITERVDAGLRDAEGRWVGTSGRARLMIYNPDRIDEDELPATMAEAADPRFAGRMALAPTNGSFHAHLTALRVTEGDDAARAWITAVADNDPVIGSNNTAMHQLLADGEADFAITNNYYLSRFLDSDPDFPVRHALFEEGDIGNLVMVAGIGMLASSDNHDAAEEFVDFLLGETAQQYFTGNVFEFPVTGDGIAAQTDLGVSYSDVQSAAPEIDLNLLGDLDGTLEMLRDAGLL